MVSRTIMCMNFSAKASRDVPSESTHRGALFMTKPAPQSQSNLSYSGAKPMSRRVSSWRILLVSFAMFSLIVLAAGIAQGQAISGNLTGTVTDASGAAGNGATVEVVNLGTGQKITATTRGSGEYNFAELPVGNYRLTVTAANFRTTTVGSVPVDLNKTGTANVQLQVGTGSTTVEVSGIASPVDTSTAQLESTYNETYSKDLGLTSNGQGGGVLNL